MLLSLEFVLGGDWLATYSFSLLIDIIPESLIEFEFEFDMLTGLLLSISSSMDFSLSFITSLMFSTFWSG
jgi:hypothetical protein